MGAGRPSFDHRLQRRVSIETPIAITCNDFVTGFARQLDTEVCRATDTLQAVTEFLRHSRPGSHRDHIDTRARIVFVDSTGNTTVICMDRWDLCVNGRIIRAYPAFYAYLRSLVPKVHPHTRPEGL